ncbi:hypothetical protein FOL47_003344 [Perkinsus chesapeaki]|uniref:Uncharacterized protein n=1 Tax=Perkinsus chesapeaki TaxID=330153 RepID=A0A7J6M8Q8_PERCH|nr:hypothetical protein FOL47_003344 [Perkinsus chesapeaki]
MVQSFLTLLPVLATVFTSVLGHPSSWCDNNEALEVYNRATMGPEFLPAGGVDMIDYDFDAAHNWYISAKDLDEREYQLWKVTADGSVRTTLLHDKADSIAVKADGSGIFAIVDNCIKLYSTVDGNLIEVVQSGSFFKTWSGLFYDDAEGVLYASDSKNDKICRFVRRSLWWDGDVIIAGQGDYSKKLDKPAGIRKLGNTLYIVQTGGRDNIVVSWDIGSSIRNYEYTFNPTGKFGIEVLDGYIFYRDCADASFLAVFSILASVFTSVLGHPSSWCDSNEALEVYNRATMGPEFLPAGGVDMIDYDFDAARNWYISAKDLDEREYQLWKVTADGSVRTTLLHDKADSIAVKADGSGIFAIVDNCINLYSTSGAGRIDKVKESSRHYTWAGLYYDDDEQVLYASDSENNKVYRFVKRASSWDSDVVASGQGNGSKKLDEPAGIRKLGNTLYIVQTGGRDNIVVSWDVGSTHRNYEYTFNPTGKFGIEVLDGYIFYRDGDDAVYRRKWNSPAGKSELVVGGCGAGSDMNQITNDGITRKLPSLPQAICELGWF